MRANTFLTTFLNQRYAMRRDILAKDVANREQLYSEFLKEVGNLYFDSINRLSFPPRRPRSSPNNSQVPHRPTTCACFLGEIAEAGSLH